VEADLRNEKIGYKIREAQMQKVPYMIILGDREVKEKGISVRSRKNGDLGSMSLDDFIAKLKEEISQKVSDV
jgi:threonyl-tRNA synthetase